MTTDLDNTRPAIVTALLAGGRSTRMGGKNKAFLPWGNEDSLIVMLQSRLRCAGVDMVISANHDLGEFKKSGLPVIVDDFGDYAGPLAGILAVMNWAADNRPDTGYIALCSCDTPFVTRDLFSLLAGAAQLSQEGCPLLVFPKTEGRVHPLHGLWSTALLPELKTYLEAGGRRVQRFGQNFAPLLVPVSPIVLKDGTEIDPFTNINTTEDYQKFRYME